MGFVIGSRRIAEPLSGFESYLELMGVKERASEELPDLQFCRGAVFRPSETVNIRSGRLGPVFENSHAVRRS